MMDQVRGFFIRGVVFVLSLGLTAAAPFISGDALQGHGSVGRNLLQAKKSCPVNFEFMNYSVITSKCKGPQYRADLCCSALKEFACPYADQLNDLTNDCASTMFSYINLYGKYPPGLFGYECREGKEGLDCMAHIDKAQNSTSSSAYMNRGIFSLFGLLSGLTAALVFLH